VSSPVRFKAIQYLTDRVGQRRGWGHGLVGDVEGSLSCEQNQAVGTDGAVVGGGHDRVDEWTG